MSAGLAPRHAFYVFAGVAVVGALVTCFVPHPEARRTQARAASATGPLPGAGASVLAHE